MIAKVLKLDSNGYARRLIWIDLNKVIGISDINGIGEFLLYFDNVVWRVYEFDEDNTYALILNKWEQCHGQ